MKSTAGALRHDQEMAGKPKNRVKQAVNPQRVCATRLFEVLRQLRKQLKYGTRRAALHHLQRRHPLEEI